MRDNQVILYQISQNMGTAKAQENEFGPLMEYYQMCRRYGTDYFEGNAGNTVCHLILADRTLVFAFLRKKDRYYVSYLFYPRYRMADGWLQIMEDVMAVRRQTVRKTNRVTESNLLFEKNLKMLEADINRSLMPFSFVISSLPEECFPRTDKVRLYNHFHVEKVVPEEILVPFHVGEGVAKTLPDYGKMEMTVIRESLRRGKSSSWEAARTDESGIKLLRKASEPVKSAGPDIMRMSAVEDAFSRLWEK